MKRIKKYLLGNPVTTGGAGYIPAALPSSEDLRNAANKLGEWFLKGLGFVGDVLSTGLAYGSTSPNIIEPISDEYIQLRKEAAGKVFGALSPLNYGAALFTGHGLNPYAGEQEIATWEPYQQALARGLEMYLTPKAVKATKKGVLRVIPEIKYKLLPYKKGYEYPIGYDSNGRLYANKNYFFRQGWDLIDDAEETGVIRVPEGDYKPAVLRKYPFLDDEFSTMQLSFKFPYFGKGTTSHFKYGIEPDLIAIPDWVPNTLWVGAGKWGDLRPEIVPTLDNPRATPLFKGLTNRFPTSKTFRYRYNPETNRYEPVVGKVKFGNPEDFAESEWTPFEDWETHLKNVFRRAWGKGTKPYTSPLLTIFPVDENIVTESPIFNKDGNISLKIIDLPGFQLKGFMRGNPLELQLSNKGTIAVNNILNYVSRRSKMEQEVVKQVLNSELFRGKSIINYNDFRRAILLNLVNVLVALSSFFPRIHNPLIDPFLLAFGRADEIINKRPHYDLGTFLTTHPLLDYSIDTLFIENALPLSRAEAFASTIEEARLKKIELALVDEIRQLQEGPLKFYTEAELFNRNMRFGGLPFETEAAYVKMGQLLKQLKDVKERLYEILNTTGGNKYYQIKHLRKDYFTSMMKRLLYKAYLNGEKTITYQYSPNVYERLQKLNLDIERVGDYITIKVPDYEGVEVPFKNGGVLKRIRR